MRSPPRLRDRGVHTPFPIQELVIADVLAGRDVLAKSPTGSGKTLAFGVPLVDRIAADARRPAALILAPTRELAGQIVDELRPLARARSLSVAAVYGGVGFEKQTRDAERAHILVATPGRLEDLLARGAFTLAHVRTLVLDEADRMLDMGFRPAVDRIVAKCPRERQTLFFSATLDGEAGRVAKAYTHDAVRHEHAPPKQRTADIEHRFVAVERDEPSSTRSSTSSTSPTWRSSSCAPSAAPTGSSSASPARASRPSPCTATSRRTSASARSPRSRPGSVDTLVATDVAARGIDVNGISHVINFDPPADREGYVHRVGRTGRAGRDRRRRHLLRPRERPRPREDRRPAAA